MDARINLIGRQQTPIVTIDNAVAGPEMWRSAALELEWSQRGDHYPGPRAVAPQAYFAALAEPLRLALGEVYRWRSNVDVLGCYFSLATTRPADLTLAQRMPHVDSYEPARVAFVHFLCAPQFGGTAFFRQRKTGLERIDSGNCDAFEQVRSEDSIRLAQLPPDYVGADSPAFERLHVCNAAFNRIVVFPSNQIHCADLSGVTLNADPLRGRLTVAGFLRPAS